MPTKFALFSAAFVAAAAAALVMARAAFADTYCNTYLVGYGAGCQSGWNYWFATDVTKDPGLERLGLHNSAGTDRYKEGSGTYIYTDRNELGMGGYMHAYVLKVSSGSAYNNASVCVC